MSVVGVDIGGTKSLAVRMNGDDIVESARVELDRSLETIEAILHSISSVIADDVTAIGVGIAGLVNHEAGTFVWGPHVPGLNLPIRRKVSAHFDLPVYVDNDANVGAVGEMRLGAAQGHRNALFVSLGTGIGGAVIIDGALYRGGSFAGEWGHVRVERDGYLCDCGKRGCWETLASGPALVRLAREVVQGNPESSIAGIFGSARITGELIVAAADGGDEIARSLVTEVGRSFGQGLAGLIAIFDPEIIVVGGGLGSVGESIVGPARRVLVDSVYGGRLRVLPTVQVATLGPASGAVGAALLAADRSQ